MGCDKLALLLKMDGFALDQRFDLPRVQFRRNTDSFDKGRKLLAKFIPPVKNVDTKRNKVSGLIVAFLNRCHGSVRFRQW